MSPPRMLRDGPRVLHLRNSCGYYGAEAVIHALARARGEQGLTVTFLDARAPNQELLERLRTDGVPATTVSCSSAIDPRPLSQVIQAARRFGAEVIHSHDYKSNVFASLAASWLKIPHVVTQHGSLTFTRSLKIYAQTETPFLRRAHRVVAVSSHSAKDALKRGVQPDRVVRIPNGVDVARFRDIDRSRERPVLVLGAAGRLSPEKGHASLLEAFVPLSRAFPMAQLVIAGDGPLRADLERRIREADLSNRVMLLGAQNDMKAFYSSIDVLAHPSTQEEMSIVLLEAAAAGLPIVASDVGETRHMFGSKAAVLVEPNKPDALRRTISELLSNRTRRRELSRAARARAIARFDVHSMCEQYEQVYRSLLQTRQSHRQPPRAKAA